MKRRFSDKRLEAGLTQESVALKLNVTQGAVSQWENGDCLPSGENLIKLATIYNCTIDELLQSVEEPKVAAM